MRRGTAAVAVAAAVVWSFAAACGTTMTMVYQSLTFCLG